MNGKIMKNLIDKLNESNLLWYSIGCAISAHNNDSIEHCQENIETLHTLLESLENSHIQEKDRVKQSLLNGISLLENECKTLIAKSNL